MSCLSVHVRMQAVPVSVNAGHSGNRECQQRHPVHVVGDGLGVLHAALYPPRPLLGLPAGRKAKNEQQAGWNLTISWNLRKSSRPRTIHANDRLKESFYGIEAVMSDCDREDVELQE